MGLSCCPQECLGINYLTFDKKYYQGNRIFKKINIKINTENKNLTPKEKSTIADCIKLLEEIEKERLEMANKFKTFLYETGACVLTNPTFERGLVTYIVYFITQLLICAKEKNIEYNINDFSLSNFITITLNKPYINLNQEALTNFIKKYNFDTNMTNILTKGKDIILDFLSILPKAQKLFENQIQIIKKLIEENLFNIPMINEILNFLEGLNFLFDFFSEITKGIMEAQSKVTNTEKYKLLFDIANKAADKKLKDPKEIALYFANGDNCGKIEDWNENMTFREIQPSKY